MYPISTVVIPYCWSSYLCTQYPLLSAVCFFRAHVSRWISCHTDRVFLARACEPHDPIYSPPLTHVRHSFSSSTIYKAFGFPCIRPTVHLICGHSGATVGLYAGETMCFVLSISPSVHRPYTKPPVNPNP